MTRLLLLLTIAVFTEGFSFESLLLEAEEADVVDGNPVVIEVTQGTIIGKEVTMYNYTYHSFQSIPFAKPPKGALRFKNPEPSGPWEGPINATKHPPACTQLLFVGQEDCLFLNVFTPANSLDSPEPLPVMVYFYGGLYVLGGSYTYSGITPLLERDVIVVTVNYRLGVLGFLSTEDDAAPGNLALKDQTLALRWVNENIAAFGGDSERVTIFGESAGASSVHYQMLTPEAAGLFSGAILQSGNSFNPFAQGRDFYNKAKTIGERFHCSTETSEDMIKCLQRKNHVLIDEMYMEFIEFYFQPVFFAPRVDGEYIPDEPVTLVKEGRYNHVPVMMGFNRDEGSLISGGLYWDPALIDDLVQNFTNNGPASLSLLPEEDPLNTAATIFDYYLGGLNFEYENIDNVTKMYGDRHFEFPLDWLTMLMGDQDEVYRWELKHRGQHSLMDLLVGLNRTISERWISHADELTYLFHPSVIGSAHTPEDIRVRELYTTMWTNFAKYRNPTPDDSLGFIWEKTNSRDLKQLVITADLPLEMETDTRTTDRAFWESLPLRFNNLLFA